MSERIHTFSAVVSDVHGQTYRAHVLGDERADGTWEARLLFEPFAGAGEALTTGRETTQPNRTDLEYWASGLEPAYLEGALARAKVVAARSGRGAVTAPPAAEPERPLPHPIIDPFEVYEQGEEILREELSALHLLHLQNIALAHRFADPSDERMKPGHERELRDLIIHRLRERLERSR